MGAVPSRPAPRLSTEALRPLRSEVGRAAAAAIATGLFFLLAARAAVPLDLLLVAAAAALCCALLAGSSRYAVTLGLLALYLGLLDGYLKLRTGNQGLTIVRDFLLYSIVAGALVRLALHRTPIRWPPFTPWVALFAGLVLVQFLNPHMPGLARGLAGIRQHLEWVPLAFFGFVVLRTTAGLRGFALLLLAIAAANGVANFVQFRLSPDELASWGPGYAERLGGTSSTTERVFYTEGGTRKVRPLGLGSDIGFGGYVGLLALPSALALLSVARGARWRIAALVLGGGAVVGIVTSQQRAALLATLIALVAFAIMAARSRRALRAILALALAGLAAYAIVSVLVGGGGALRYETLRPGTLLETVETSRGRSLTLFDDYVAALPLGAGVGTGGPAAAAGGPAEGLLDFENQLNFLVIELGVPGLFMLLGLLLWTLWSAFRRVRRIPDVEQRLLVAAIAAPLAGLLSTWPGAVTTATTPNAPYLWFAIGALAWWTGSRRGEPARKRAA